MADIEMCGGEGCRRRERCYRFTAPKNKEWQSFFVRPPLKKNGKCDYFWPNKNRRKEKKNGR
jgi:hypothetical protein